jgi:pimeloyl-ACP methyl ester carboxylesterase
MTKTHSTVLAAGQELPYMRIGEEFDGTPLVFLHEGLGSIELWRGFPTGVVAGARQPGFVYSRRGNGWSPPLTAPRLPDYMHREALETLPDLIGTLVGEPPILVGHSDGASIALIYAGSGHPVAGLVLIAPHVLVEEEGLEAIRAIRRRFPETDLRERMARYHTDPAMTFYGWADVWLSPEFRSWNIEEFLPGVHNPTLVVQGDQDEYGTMKQLDAIDEGLRNPARRLLVEGAGHSPHLTHAELVTGTVVDFVAGLD